MPDQTPQNETIAGGEPAAVIGPPALSKSAMKKQMKQKRLEARKAERKMAEKERRRQNLECRRREWDEKLAGATEEERSRMVNERKEMRKEQMGKRAEEREMRTQRLKKAMETGPKVILDLEFSHLMSPSEIHSLAHQIMYCYAVNGKCASPGHLWLTGCSGDLQVQLQRLPGYDKWMIEKENRSYIEAFREQKENLVYLTADADTVLDELDVKKIYIIGGLVDRNRWKGITMKKASDQGIRAAKLPIGNYLKMSGSQVLTVNQVVEILLKFLETKDWRSAFFQVIPPRKRGEVEAKSEDAEFDEDEGANEGEAEDVEVPDVLDHLQEAEFEEDANDKADDTSGSQDGEVEEDGSVHKKRRMDIASNHDYSTDNVAELQE